MREGGREGEGGGVRGEGGRGVSGAVLCHTVIHVVAETAQGWGRE